MAMKFGKRKKEFVFGVSIRGYAATPPPGRAERLRDTSDDPPYFVRGVQADSRDEYWTALALERIEEETGWGWKYQFEVRGGRRRLGGNVVDFIVFTPGMWTILDPMGRYWHTGGREDRWQMEQIARDKNWRLVAWFTDETPTRESVYVKLRNELGV